MSNKASMYLAFTSALLIASPAVLAGNDGFVEGSGWFSRSGQKTVFALAAECEAGQLRGHFAFKDNALNLGVRDARITAIRAGGDDTRIIEGDAVIVGASGGDSTEGSFLIEVRDAATDTFMVEFSNGFAFGGFLEGGDIRIHGLAGDSACAPAQPGTAPQALAPSTSGGSATISAADDDPTPPVVVLSAPTAGATITGMVTVTAIASDVGSGMAGVRFYVDGQAVGAEDTTAPYSLTGNSFHVANGSHTLHAVARDVAGNLTTSAIVTVTTNNDKTPPSVSMSSPGNGATVSGLVTLTATASDSGSGVAGVQLYVNGNALGAEDTTAPYSLVGNSQNVPNGSYTLTAVARDVAGNTATAASITVTVNNPTVPTGPTGPTGDTFRIEQDSPSVVYNGTWITPTDPSLSGGSVEESNTGGDIATLTFEGTGVAWIGYKCKCGSGYAKVYVDGNYVATVTGYSESVQAQALIYSVSGLARGTHTLRIEVTGEYDRAGDTAYVIIDAFDITR